MENESQWGCRDTVKALHPREEEGFKVLHIDLIGITQATGSKTMILFKNQECTIRITVFSDDMMTS